MGSDPGRPPGLLAALQFLTRIPIRLTSAPDLARSVPWFPIAGALIGTAVGGAAAGLMELVPASVAGALAVIAGVLITGAFHEDGLADMADAMGGTTPERRREILKDSRHGSYGVAAMCSTIVLRIVCVASLGPAAAFGGLVAAHTLARGASVAVMSFAPDDPTDGLSGQYTRTLSRRHAIVGVAASVALAAIAVGWWVGPLLVATAGGATVVTALARRAFGGVSGDILGAIEQVGECLALVVVSGLTAHHALWWT